MTASAHNIEMRPVIFGMLQSLAYVEFAQPATVDTLEGDSMIPYSGVALESNGADLIVFFYDDDAPGQWMLQVIGADGESIADPQPLPEINGAKGETIARLWTPFFIAAIRSCF